jgi:hypothetical protein
LADLAAEWRRPQAESVGPAGARSLVPRPCARARRRARSAGGSDADAEMSGALETVDALASVRGAGERQAAAAGDTSRGHSRLGAPRTAAAALNNWSAAGDLSSSSHTAVWSPAERQRFAARGGLSAAAACSISSAVNTTFDPDRSARRIRGRGPDALRAGSDSRASNVGSADAEGEREGVEGVQGASCVIGGPGKASPARVPRCHVVFAFHYNRNHLLVASPLVGLGRGAPR